MHAIASNGMRAAVEEMLPKMEKAAGGPIEFQYGTTTDLVRKIEAGQPFDIVILTADAIGGLVKSGKAAGEMPLARSGVGVGMKSGVPKPAIGNSAQMKAALEKAKSITYAREGASRPFVEKMLATMGIAQQASAKTVLAAGSGAATESVANGSVDIVLTQDLAGLSVDTLEVDGVTLPIVGRRIPIVADDYADAYSKAEAAKDLKSMRDAAREAKATTMTGRHDDDRPILDPPQRVSGMRVPDADTWRLPGRPEGLDGAAEVIARGEPGPPFDYHLPMLSLPYALRNTVKTVPKPVSYLAADPALVRQWGARMAAPKLKVGIAWAGGTHFGKAGGGLHHVVLR